MPKIRILLTYLSISISRYF